MPKTVKKNIITILLIQMGHTPPVPICWSHLWCEQSSFNLVFFIYLWHILFTWLYLDIYIIILKIQTLSIQQLKLHLPSHSKIYRKKRGRKIYWGNILFTFLSAFLYSRLTLIHLVFSWRIQYLGRIYLVKKNIYIPFI